MRVTVRLLAAVAALAAATGAAGAGDTYYLGEKQGAILLTNIPSGPGLHPLDPEPGAFRRGDRAVPFRALIREAAVASGLREELLEAVIAVESGFRPGAVSPKGAMGLMQLMPETAATLGVSRPFDPRENVFAGARHLRQLLDRFEGDVELALAAYNAGEWRVRSRGAIPSIPETRRYIDKILARLGPSFRSRRAAGDNGVAAPEAGNPPGDIFVHVDEQGKTTFTDVPGPGARPLR